MSTIVKAMRDLKQKQLFATLNLGQQGYAEELRQQLFQAGTAINWASNRGQMWRRVRGAPNYRHCVWALTLEGWVAAYRLGGRDLVAVIGWADPVELRPCWDRGNKMWVWGAVRGNVEA